MEIFNHARKISNSCIGKNSTQWINGSYQKGVNLTFSGDVIKVDGKQVATKKGKVDIINNKIYTLTGELIVDLNTL